MKITKAKIISLLFVAIFSCGQVSILMAVPEATAAGLWDSQEGRDELAGAFGETNPEDPTDVRVVVSNVIKVFIGFMGVVFLVLSIVAGFKWMTAGGNEQAVSDAKSQLANAVIGLFVVLLAYSITYFVTERLVQGSTGSIW